MNWESYYGTPERVGKLCYYLCSRKSYLPIRDVLNDQGKGNKIEPNYETATYNWCARCNQCSVHAAVKDRLSHVLFVTRYTGRNSEYWDRYFIVGYYEIGWTATVENEGKTRTAIRARRMCFVPIEEAYEITPDRWRCICPGCAPLHNLRNTTQRISGSLLNEILQQLEKYDATGDYLRKVAHLKAEYSPFKKIPTGRIFIINVGANTNSPLQSPLFKDGTFEFVPIPEHNSPDSNEFLSYADLRQFYEPGQPLLELFPEAPVAQEKVHDDPEFLTLTYGDNIAHKRNLRNLRARDFLFFLARLVTYDGQRYDYDQAMFALIGYLEVAEWADSPDKSLLESPAFIRNAHVRRWQTDPASFTNFAIFKGTANSRRFRYAVPFDREFVVKVPILTASGSEWKWNWNTDLSVIGSYTRTARMHVDPGTDDGMEQAKRFWQHIWQVQKWSATSPSHSCRGCDSDASGRLGRLRPTELDDGSLHQSEEQEF